MEGYVSPEVFFLSYEKSDGFAGTSELALSPTVFLSAMLVVFALWNVVVYTNAVILVLTTITPFAALNVTVSYNIAITSGDGHGE